MGTQDLELEEMEKEAKKITNHTLRNYDRRNQFAIDKDEFEVLIHEYGKEIYGHLEARAKIPTNSPGPQQTLHKVVNFLRNVRMKVNPKPNTDLTKVEIEEFFVRVLRDMSHAENID
jgi:hypothetical protein